MRAGFFVCKLKKMSNSKKETSTEGGGGGEGQEAQEREEAVGVPDHDGTPSKLFPTAKGDKAGKRKGEPAH